MIPTESIGSIPRTPALIQALTRVDAGEMTALEIEPLYEEAVRETMAALAATGSPIYGDGEQRKTHNFATYAVEGLPTLASDGFLIPFSDGHVRQLPRLTRGPFRFARYAHESIPAARRHSSAPYKQAIISPSALSLFYPAQGLLDYPREAFINDLIGEQEKEIRGCFAAGAAKIQIDFTEGRLSVKLDPSGGLLNGFIELNNLVLSRFTPQERSRIGIHTCPGSDLDCTHSAEVDYAELLPSLFETMVGSFYIAVAGEKDRTRALRVIGRYLKPGQRAFIGVIDVINPRVESPLEVRDLLLEAANHIPVGQLGSTDDCGFSPFCDDTTTSREIAFAKIRARVEGTRLASEKLGL